MPPSARCASGVLEFDAPADAVYVRVQCWGEGEQMAWTQPFFVLKT